MVCSSRTWGTKIIFNERHQLSLEKIKDQFRTANQEKAIEACKLYLQKSPNNLEALKLLAKMYGVIADYKNAILMSKKYHQLDKDDVEVIYNLAFFERQSLHFQESEKWIKVFLELKPDAYEGWVALSEVQIKLGQYEKALEYSQTALKYEQNDPTIFFSRALCFKMLKRYQEAITELNTAKQLTPQSLEVLIELGEIYGLLENSDSANECFNNALQISPKDLESLFIQTRAKLALGRLNDAFEDYNTLIQNNYKLGEVLHLKALLLMQLKKYDMAIPLLIDACEFGNKASLLSVSQCYHDLEKYQEAITYIDLYLSTNKEDANAWLWRAKNLLELNQRQEAIKDLTQALEIDQDSPFALSFLVHQFQHLCSWKNLEEYKQRLKQAIETKKTPAMPFIALSTFDDPKIQQLVIQEYLDYFRIKPNLIHTETLVSGQKKDKIKVAYFSPDFGEHPVSYLAVEMFELHDRSKFEIYAFSLYNAGSDSFKSRVVNSFDHFIDVSTKSDDEIINLAKSLSIDIAVDLCGITAKNRFNIFAQRVAPLQLSYLGYLGTMGGLVDYILADQALIPEQNTQYYSEKIIYLPSYQINDRQKNNSGEIILRSALGIPSEVFVYGSLNNSYKISPEVFRVWMDLLKEVEDSVLLLSTPQDVIKENLLKEAQNHSVDSDRIIFLERAPREKYLSYLKLIDLFLDTPGYGAGTTASDALWMGVPVLTVQGNSMPSRIASSVLTAFGLPELITNSLDDYKSLAIHLAQDRNEFNTLKNKTNSLIDKSLLFDSVKTTKHIEKAYQIIYQRRKDNLPVDHVVIVDES